MKHDDSLSPLLTGQRVLVHLIGAYRAAGAAEEVRVLEFSPSLRYVRIMNTNGLKFWRRAEEVRLVELLQPRETPDPESLPPLPPLEVLT